MHRLAFLGPPGAGKGTQATELARRMGLVHLSTGDLLRAAVRQRTALGEEADRYMRAGALVPDALVLGLIAERLRAPEATAGLLFDGFPRTVAQAEALEQLTPVEVVVFFDLPEAMVVQRLTERRSCPTCGTVYNLRTQPPARSGVCDRDGTTLLQRTDDTAEAVHHRFVAYRENTEPLLDFYRERGRLRVLDARGSPAEVGARLRALLAA